jgi:pyruvate,orthophosphate dikinase
MSFIYHFSKNDSKSFKFFDKNLLGNKGANLAEMASLGFNIPAGFIVTSDLCKYYYDHNRTLPASFEDELKEAINHLEKHTGKILGGDNPLLLSVRSGASVSMPGMMETILNVGLNDKSCDALAAKTNIKFVLDSYRRFLAMYGSTVLGIPSYLFQSHVREFDIKNTDIDQLNKIIQEFKNIIKSQSNLYNTNVYEQLKNSILAVLNSWTFEKAVTYRKIYQISDSLGTAVIVQAMVFGNLNEKSGTGVVFSRNPVCGNKELYGEFLLAAQGEDIVSGECNPTSISDANNPNGICVNMAAMYEELKLVVSKLENHFQDMQDVEFTIENEKLYILQTRNGKRSVAASIKIVVDMVNEGIISKQEAIARVDPESLSQLMHMFVDYDKPLRIIGKGLAASPGSACGLVAFTSDEAETISSYASVILVRQDTSPEDIKGMHFSSGILTNKGGMTSHAAVVARGMGRPCICGANIDIDALNKTIKIGDVIISSNDYITIDGSTGNIILGTTELISQKFSEEFAIFMSWVDEFRTLKVRANAENIQDIQTALKFGSEGIGLCRTEHMLFEQARLKLIRQIVIAGNLEQRIEYINLLFKLHKQDFKEIFGLMEGLSVNVRLFDPPLHEFLPKEDFHLIAHSLEINEEVLIAKIKNIEEKNPMLGHRGCRLGITYPELYEMQVKAILEAGIELKKEQNISFNLEIMLPLIATRQELVILTNLVHLVAERVQNDLGWQIEYKIGTMIELPRAALIAEQLAEHVDYFSFGTNDLTQTTYGISRDDMAYFSHDYKDQGIFKDDPFTVLDEEGVGKLITMACEKGKKIKPNLSLSLCGEHGGNPQSINFCNQIGLNYVSCSPFRIIIAKLAAAQANLNLNK